jgi:putative DNA primase/helicase
VITKAEDCMRAANLDLYQRGSFLVRPAWEEYSLPGQKVVKAKRLVSITPYHLMEQMGRAAIFMKYNKTENAWKPFSPTYEMAQMYIGREGSWRLPPLAGVISAPTLRADGSIFQTPGYDPQTQIIYEPESVEYPTVPENPTRDDALRALAVLAEPIAKFPFVDETARSAMLAAMLTACIRRSLRHAPAFALDAPTQGTGKGKLQSVLAALAEGHVAIPISAGDGGVELEKRIDSELIRGAPIISIDNVMNDLDNDKLATILTEPIVACRVLGQSKTPRTPTGALVTITGNNLTLLAELCRRTIRIRIDARMERPWDRQFAFDPVAKILDERGKYVVAALTILRAHHVAGRPKPGGTLGSFEDWYAWVVGALVWLGCKNPKTTIEVTTAEDPRLSAHAAVIGAWHAVFGDQPVTVKEVCQGRRAQAQKDATAVDPFVAETPEQEALREALKGAIQAKNGNQLDTNAVGQWLKKYRDRPSGDYCITKTTKLHGSDRWVIAKVITNVAAE